MGWDDSGRGIGDGDTGGEDSGYDSGGGDASGGTEREDVINCGE